jgi:hypothetical protein
MRIVVTVVLPLLSLLYLPRTAGQRITRANLSREAKVNIAVRAKLGEDQATIARDYNTVPEAVSRIKHGATSVDTVEVEKKLTGIQDTALLKLMSSLNLITDDKLKKLSAKELSSFAANMSRVVKDTLPEQDKNQAVSIHLYAPEIRQESQL